MLDNCILQDLECAEGPNIGGSNETIWVMPVRDVISTPQNCTGTQLGPDDHIELKAGKESAAYHFDSDSLQYSCSPAKNSFGEYYNIRLSGNRAKMSAAQHVEANKLTPGHYIIHYLDANGTIRVLGSLNRPMRFQYSEQSGKIGSDPNQSTWSFSGVSLLPPPVLDPSIQPPNEVAYPDAELVISLSSTCNSQLDASFSKLGSGALISTSPASLVLIYEFWYQGQLVYSAEIAGDADPTQTGNWTPTAGTHSTTNFNSQIVAGIENSPLPPAYNFILDTTDISDSLTGAQDVIVKLKVREGTKESPYVSANLEQCGPQIHDPSHNVSHN